jgi:hypothetical protein
MIIVPSTGLEEFDKVLSAIVAEPGTVPDAPAAEQT